MGFGPMGFGPGDPNTAGGGAGNTPKGCSTGARGVVEIIGIKPDFHSGGLYAPNPREIGNNMAP